MSSTTPRKKHKLSHNVYDIDSSNSSSDDKRITRSSSKKLQQEKDNIIVDSPIKTFLKHNVNHDIQQHILILQHSLINNNNNNDNIDLNQPTIDSIELYSYQNIHNNNEYVRYCIINNDTLCQVQCIYNNIKNKRNNTYNINSIDYAPYTIFNHNNIISNQNIYLCTIYNPIYLLIDQCIPSLNNIIFDKYIDLNTILNNNNFPITLLKNNNFINKLNELFDTVQGWDNLMYKVNINKVIIYLNQQYNNIIQYLNHNDSMSLRFSDDINDNTQTHDNNIQIIGYKLLHEHIHNYWFDLLIEHNKFDVTLLSNSNKITRTKITETTGKLHDSKWLNNTITADIDFNSTENLILKSKQENNNNIQNNKINNKTKNKLSNVSTKGMSSMMSYFNKK